MWCLPDCLHSEPGFDRSGSIWSCGISPPLPTHQFKVVPRSSFSPLGSLQWLSNPQNSFAYKLVEYPGGLACEPHWSYVFGESVPIENYYLPILVIFFIIPMVLIAILYFITYLKLQSKKIPGDQSANFEQQRKQRKRNVLKMAFAIVLGFAVCWLPLIIFWFLFPLLCSGYKALWLPILYYRCLFYGSRQLCLKSLHLFYFQQKLSPRA